MSSRYLSVLAGLSLLVSAPFAAAGLISVEAYTSGQNDAVRDGELGGYAMTRFDLLDQATLPAGGINTIYSPVDGSALTLQDNETDDRVDAFRASDKSWWRNDLPFDFDIFTTHSNTITITLPEKTLAFAFNVGASFGGSAWFTATSGADERYHGTFAVGGRGEQTPGFGVYADNSAASAGACSYISQITVDPRDGWGVGNFAIAQDAGNCSTDVPEPGSLALLGLGLLGLRLARRRVAA